MDLRSEPTGEVTLEMTRESMRSFGYRVIDSIVNRMSGLHEQSVVNVAMRDETEALFRQDAPEEGTELGALMLEFEENVAPRQSHVDHPRMFAFIPGAGTFVGAMGDALASGYNIYAGTWIESSAAHQIEMVVIDWFRSWLGMPATAGGTLLSGGSVANLTALVLAREARLGSEFAEGMIYMSEHAHSSVERGARILGFRTDQVRKVAVDSDLKIDLGALRGAVEEDRSAGRIPFCMVANAGSTTTGTIDPLPQLAGFCAENRLWLHVDGAYGGFAALDERGRRLLEGIERADSVSLDPHKWLYTPFEAGCILVRDAKLLLDTFRVYPDYLIDVAGGPDHPNFSDQGIQLSRSCRALKIWMTIKHFGLARIRAVIGRTMDLAAYGQEMVERVPGAEIVSPVSLSVFTFRFVPEGVSDEDTIERFNEQILRRVWESGRAMLSSSRVGGKYVIRLCVVNHNTRKADVEEVVDLMASLARETG